MSKSNFETDLDHTLRTEQLLDELFCCKTINGIDRCSECKDYTTCATMDTYHKHIQNGGL